MREKLHPFHVGLLVFMVQAGVVSIFLPRMLAQYMGYNGWVSLLLFSAVATFNIFLISVVYRLSDGKSIFQIIEQSLPKVIVFPLYTVLVSVWTLIGCIAAKQYILLFTVFVFPTTPPMYMKFLFDIIAYSLITKGIYNISKAATVFFWMVIWTALLLLFFLKGFEWVNLTPFFFKESSDVIVGGLSIFTAFLGYELVLLLFPYVNSKKGFMSAVYFGNFLTTFIYLAICLTCFGFYSFKQLTRMKFPLIDLLAYIRLPFVERVENIFIALYLVSALMSITMYIWAASETAQSLIPRASKRWITGVLVCGAFAVSWIPDVLSEVELWLKYLGYMASGIAFGLPLLLIAILAINNGGKKLV
ncbi:spore germination protein (amino acid permease) [Paenibacillus cellulosilyticus]|uniref:Spore germination protein (Amino acid permease) n=2 Tax=Paenibacillus cellulosilyticus TaxID=375489 RepID=A0A2V2YS60_9BACL|nr:spore germination protein (amino acid permease) [Paenibacillus cellulosilyticus]